MITWNTGVDAPCCPGEIINHDGQTILVQDDLDHPGVASSFGWSLRSVQRERCDECGHSIDWYTGEDDDSIVFGDCLDCGKGFEPCHHSHTDGTVDCPECGVTASRFIAAAGEWLRDNDGVTADDPGYFD